MDTPQPPNNDANWERKTLEKLVFAALDEQRARRRWGIAFKILGFGYLLAVLLAVVDWGASTEHQERHTAMVSLIGVIEAKGDASAENLVAALNSAFEEKNAAGVILRINSPGGSPVQAGIVNDEIRRLRTKFPDKPLYAVVEDMCASGGYYVAAAADSIYVNKASIVGSIGVLMDGFGFTGTMDKFGVERRLLTAGENKGFLDPFSPQAPQQKAHAQLLLDDIHKQFIDVVKTGRGKRLKETPDMFSGLMWTGAQSIQLGLADGYGSVDSVARDVIKAEKIFDYSVKDNIAERFAKRLGAGTAASFWRGVSESAQSVRLF
ncbi:MAG: S49 family peptidase [Dechloromonas sp.]|uniref:S49 family peptidase n=1 Tax=Dechloromonas sp. CZR5 TaxID=2608630 RepID=UPI00123CF338|nr:S49 family peptidase [Dechloromonas sp. CZR5]MBL8403993.1 S49 family peptidase [Dechloromonas sp.]